MTNKSILSIKSKKLPHIMILTIIISVLFKSGVTDFCSNISDVDFWVQFYYNDTIVKEIILTDQNEESSVDAFTLSYEDQVSILIFKKNLTPAGPEILCTISSISLSV